MSYRLTELGILVTDTSRLPELPSQSMLHSWSASFGIDADALFALLIRTLSGIENWKIESASQSTRVVHIVPVQQNDLPEKLQNDRTSFIAIQLVVLYQHDNASLLVLHAYSKEPIERKVAEETIPVTSIFDLSGQGPKLDETVYHLKELLGPGADVIIPKLNKTRAEKIQEKQEGEDL